MSSIEDREKKRRRRRDHVVKDLHSPKYRQRVKPGVKHVKQVPNWSSIDLDDDVPVDPSDSGSINIDVTEESKDTE